MPMLKINEIFYSIQGEGLQAGTPAIFVRFAGCNLNCDFCDTDHSVKEHKKVAELLADVLCLSLEHHCKHVVFTGGEPALQLTAKLIDSLVHMGFKLSLETNGTVPFNFDPCMLDYICVSPKLNTTIMLLRNPDLVINELRVLVDGDLPLFDVGTTRKVCKIEQITLSPVFVDTDHTASYDNEQTKKNIRRAVQLCMENPVYRLSVQIHKLLGLK